MKKASARQDANETSLTEDLYRELEALKIRIAFAEIHEAEWNSASPNQQLSDEGKRRVLKAIDKRLRRRKYVHFAKTTLPKAGRIAAAVLSVFFIGLTAAVASVRSVRVSVLNFIMGIEEAYTELGVGGEMRDVPSEWQGECYPTYIPEGFTLDYVDPIFAEAQYANSSGQRIIFKEYELSEYVNFDTEDSSVLTIAIQGAEALISEKDGRVSIIWATDDRYLLLRCDTPRETAIQIAESVTNVK